MQNLLSFSTFTMIIEQSKPFPLKWGIKDMQDFVAAAGEATQADGFYFWSFLLGKNILLEIRLKSKGLMVFFLLLRAWLCLAGTSRQNLLNDLLEPPERIISKELSWRIIWKGLSLSSINIDSCDHPRITFMTKWLNHDLQGLVTHWIMAKLYLQMVFIEIHLIIIWPLKKYNLTTWRR